MRHNLIRSLLLFLFVNLWLPVSCAFASAPVGVATEVTGMVELERGGESFALTEGVNVSAGDIIRTDDNAATQIDMDDGSMLSLGENSEITIRDYSLGKDKNVLSASVEMAVGWLRFAVAHLRSEGSYQIHMPTAVLGVRGTEGLIRVEPEDGHFSSHVIMDEGTVELAKGIRKGRLFGSRLMLRGGEYAERGFSGPFVKQSKAPAWLVAMISKRMKARLVRRTKLLKKRGVLPRKLLRSLRRNVIKRAIEKKKRRLNTLRTRQKFKLKLERQQRLHKREPNRNSRERRLNRR